MPKTLIYHDICADGFCAAWLFHQVYPDAEFIPAQYGQDPPDCLGKDVVIADFSYKRAEMSKIIQTANSVVVLDHHKTAEAELEGMCVECEGYDVTIVFDMNKSGGRLMWEWLYPAVPHRQTPWLVQYTEDRDLWRWCLPKSKEVNAFLASHIKDFKVWDEIEYNCGVEQAAVEGTAILRYQQGVIDHHVKNAVMGSINGYNVPIINATTLISEIGNELAKGHPFAAMYFVKGDEKIWSLRSAPDGVDVSEIAKQLGGGGHKHAAGFKSAVRDY